MIFYKVIVSPKALSMLNDYINYIQYTLMNSDAAKRVWDDAIKTTDILKTDASVFQLCNNPVLRELGYRSIKLKNHNYVMFYRIENKFVYVEAIYHQLQDYENLFVDDLKK